LSDFAEQVRAALDTDTRSARAVWQALGARGLLDTAELAELLPELDSACPVGVVLSVCVQVATVLPILQGESGMAAEVYAQAVAGKCMLALAVTDAEAAGSDLDALATTAKLADGQVIINGRKRWITNACTADYALVLARHRPARHFTSYLWVLVPMSAVRAESAGGLFADAGVGHLQFTDVRVDHSYLVGAPGRGLVSFGRHVTTERLAGGLWAAAMCRRVLTETLAVLSSRRLDGEPLWTNEAIRHRFARCLVETRRIEALCEQHETWSLLSSMVLKAAVAESLDLVLTECASLVGADAFADGGLAQLRVAAGMFGIAGGARGAMLAGIASHAHEMLGLRE
jgi:citronellyl-CoA dehydrogenase